MTQADCFVGSNTDLLTLLDRLLEPRQSKWWDEFFADRNKKCPFFIEWPDENLVEWISKELIHPGRVLELGCGHGRNALYLARHGYTVDAIDFSQTAIEWARERQQQAIHSGDCSDTMRLRYWCQSVFDRLPMAEPCDFIYDCGCFHHLAPHRRQTYLDMIRTGLKPGGLLGMVCFAPEGGSGLTDLQVYQQRKLGGGLGYTEASFQSLFKADFDFIEFRRMQEISGDVQLFGKSFCWVALMRYRHKDL